MATLTSVKSGNNTVYTITDIKGNTVTVTAPPFGSTGLTFASSGGLLPDGQAELSRLILMTQTGLRPNVIPGTPESFSN